MGRPARGLQQPPQGCLSVRRLRPGLVFARLGFWKKTGDRTGLKTRPAAATAVASSPTQWRRLDQPTAGGVGEGGDKARHLLPLLSMEVLARMKEASSTRGWGRAILVQAAAATTGLTQLPACTPPGPRGQSLPRLQQQAGGQTAVSGQPTRGLTRSDGTTALCGPGQA